MTLGGGIIITNFSSGDREAASRSVEDGEQNAPCNIGTNDVRPNMSNVTRYWVTMAILPCEEVIHWKYIAFNNLENEC